MTASRSVQYVRGLTVLLAVLTLFDSRRLETLLAIRACRIQ